MMSKEYLYEERRAVMNAYAKELARIDRPKVETRVAGEIPPYVKRHVANDLTPPPYEGHRLTHIFGVHGFKWALTAGDYDRAKEIMNFHDPEFKERITKRKPEYLGLHDRRTYSVSYAARMLTGW